jgi:hypothetical protein
MRAGRAIDERGGERWYRRGMIAYDELAAALERWRNRHGLPATLTDPFVQLEATKPRRVDLPAKQ